MQLYYHSSTIRGLLAHSLDGLGCMYRDIRNNLAKVGVYRKRSNLSGSSSLLSTMKETLEDP